MLFICFLCFLSFLAGCANNSNLKFVDPYSSSTTLSPEEGFIVARVIDASGDAIPLNQLTIIPKNLNESEENNYLRLRSLENTVGTSTIFFSAVGSGEYSIDSIRAYYANHQYYISKFAVTDTKLSTFLVEPGKITDIGTIVFYPKAMDDQYKNIIVRSPTSLPLKDVMPYAASVMDFAPIDAAWIDDEYDDERRTNYISAARNPVTFNERYMAPDGTLYFIGKLGAIVSRSRNGEWYFDAVDTDFDLHAIQADNQGNFVVGGDLGAVYLKRQGDTSWISAPLSTEYSVRSVQFGLNGIVDVIAYSHKHVVVFRGNIGNDTITWRPMKAYDANEEWVDVVDGEVPSAALLDKYSKPKKITFVNLEKSDDKNLIFINSKKEAADFFVESGSHIFEYDPVTWDILGPGAIDKRVDAILNAGVVRMGYKTPSFSSGYTRQYLRYDNTSKKWIKMANSFDRCPDNPVGDRERKCLIDDNMVGRNMIIKFTSAPVFSSDNDGIGVISINDIKTKAWSGVTTNNISIKMLKTSDGGATWTLADDELPKPYCLTLIPEVTKFLLLSCDGVSGDFYESYDQGETWEHVREQESF